MKLTFLEPVAFTVHPGSPEVDEKRQSIRITVRDVAFDGQTASFSLAAAFLFPSDVADRYQNVEEAMVIVVHDIEQADGGSVQTKNTFVVPSPDDPGGPNQISEPPLPMPGKGSVAASGFRGGWLDTKLAFPCTVAVPRYRPSVYVYLVLENYFSNVIGLDLIDMKAIEF